MPDPSTPHDALFKNVFSDAESVHALIRPLLDESLARALDPRSMHLEQGSFVDEELRESHSDLVFSAKLRDEPVLVYVLLEHQRIVDVTMPYRMLRYVVRLWESWLREHPGPRIPAVIPIVLHQGARPWSGPRRLEELLAVPEDLVPSFRTLLPAFELTLEDLGREDLGALAGLKGPPAMRFALVLFKLAASGQEPASALSSFEEIVHEILADPHGRTRFEALLRYILVTGESDPAVLRDQVRLVAPKAREVIMSTADKLRAEGRVEGQREFLAQLLKERFGDLDEKICARVEQASPEDLQEWGKRVLTAKTLASVFKKRKS